MILLSHALIGASVGRLMPSPLLAFCAGLVSHYAVDAIPHWDYTLPSIFKKKHSDAITRVHITDVIHAGIDFAAGIGLAFLVFPTNTKITGNLSLLFGALGGIVPDLLQFCYFCFKKEPLTTHQRFHDWIHSEKTLKYRPALGVLFQIILVMGFILASYILK